MMTDTTGGINEAALRACWGRVVDRIKHEIIHPTLWRSLEASVPVTVEGSEFVVGFAPGNFHMSGHLLTSEHKNSIERALRDELKRPCSLRIIEGTAIQDWVNTKAKDESRETMHEIARQKAAKEIAASRSWDSLMEMSGRKYAGMQLRQLPQTRAVYVQEMVQAISDAMDELMPKSAADELAERSLARVIEKVATYADVPALVIALEIHRYRQK
jgi:hypothetical protein